MKQFILSMVIAVVASVTMSAQNSYNSLYDRFSSADGVTKVNVGPLLMGLCNLCMDEDDDEARQLVKGISSVSVMDLSDCSEEVRKDFREAADKINSKDMELLMEVSDESDILKIFVKKSGDHLSRFLLVNIGDDPCMVNISGKISMKDIDKLIEQNRGGADIEIVKTNDSNKTVLTYNN